MTQLPAHFLPRPPMADDPATLAAFADLYATAVAPGRGEAVPYTLATPRWQFLCWLTDTQDVVLHGSGNPAIAEFEPRQSNDIHEFGNRAAVYAASDGLWAMYFAIVNRDGPVTSLVNACFRVVEPDGTRGGPYYYFSINRDAWAGEPWRAGTVYILPRGPFAAQPPGDLGALTLEIAQWASPTPVRPLARLAVTPADFPLLAQITPHDPAVLLARAAADPAGFPWVDE